MSTFYFTSTQLFRDFPRNFQLRKLLLEKPFNQRQIIAATPLSGEKSFDPNFLTILLILLCALICSVGLASVIKCKLRCSRSSPSFSESSSNFSSCFRNKGIKQKTPNTFTAVKYSPELNLPGLDTECVICLSEFEPGELVRLLTKCNHGFHIGCIDKWLRSHSSCPKCRHCLIGTCQKIVGCSHQANSSATSTAVQENVACIILPLEPEAIVRSCRELS